MYLYKKDQLSKLKFKFAGIESVEQSYSQLLQEMFVLAALNGKRDGKFFEVGAGFPQFISNTYLLESKFGWNGISIDISEHSRDMFKDDGRSSDFILGNALELDYDKIFKESGLGQRIDYLTLDLEPNSQTLQCLQMIPMNEYRFSVVTYETDAYDENAPGGVPGSEQRRDESREIFKKYGYELISGNLSNLDAEHPMEDWYVDPQVVDKNTIDKLKRDSDETMAAHHYMLNQ